MGKKQRVGVVYSTDPDYQYQYEGDEAQAETLEPAQQRLVVRLERRGGKPSTMVDGFVGTDDDLADLARMLKNKCGVGGSAKEGVVNSPSAKPKLSRNVTRCGSIFYSYQLLLISYLCLTYLLVISNTKLINISNNYYKTTL